ncbi:hypothetical protein [Tsukamurella sputi]|uniref:hypothetical protein n=1 Tax=Tsukamurella sputi TaxID=2591848 RepID=UPI001877E695|nr:hypothetical protein [Tsukamurella sputi]
MTAPAPIEQPAATVVAPAAPAAPSAPVPPAAPTPAAPTAATPPTAPAAPEAPAAPQQETPEAAPEDELPAWARDQLKKARNEAKNLRDRLKQQEPLVAAAQEAERAKMTELDRTKADLAAMQQQLEARDTDVLKAVFQLTDEDLEFIGGGTFEERSARAEKFAARVNASKTTSPGGPPSNRPQVNLRPGASPDVPVQPDDSYPSHWLPKSAQRS